MPGPAYPEWAGYLAAFQTYVDAHDDDELQDQARTLMGYFADGLLDGKGRPIRRPAGLRHGDLTLLLEQLGIASPTEQ